MIASITAESVLRQLRQLPPRERLRVVAQVLPELERDLPVTNPADLAAANLLAEFDSWATASDEALLKFEAALIS
jgi:hypothetical protein